jgi:hypothetical protein
VYTLAVLFVVGYGEGNIGVGFEYGASVSVAEAILVLHFLLQKDVQGNFDAFENVFEVFEHQLLVLWSH